MNRRLLALLLALSSVFAPASSRAAGSAPENVDGRAEALFDAGKYLEAIKVWVDALDDVPESLDSRGQRNSWAVGAVNAYGAAFDADPKECSVITDGLALADRYLKALLDEYGRQATNSDEYAGMSVLRSELDKARATHACPEGVVAHLPAPTVEFLSTRGKSPLAPPAVSIVEPVAPTPVNRPPVTAPTSGRGLAIGTGVSASLMVGAAIVSLATALQVRKPQGTAYQKIYDSSVANNVMNDQHTDLCAAGKDIAEIATSCQRWTALNRTFIAASTMAGIFGVSTGIFLGLLIHQRRQTGKAVALLRHHQAHLNAAPQRGTGASLSVSFRF